MGADGSATRTLRVGEVLGMHSVRVGGHRAFFSRVLAIRIKADIRNALKKEADRRVLGESYLAEVLVEKGLKGLPLVELG